ncbi:hypothetical protein FPZ24_16820 [Sphingomonas panacisoli]|uniref:Uncharacterized protein n=1 Tax=Sphingomonas panacisoli TaxID=1813879 RepID=A0A5B8LL43_9SPHN|nr:hypothetical protein [Sphingomonas panacisoli]QDZ08931.1 hypothetical protein FPZ24_16820 [Sphingomonas panacisoli]
MSSARLAVVAIWMVSVGAAAAIDMLPLKQGIYVPVGRACKGASNAEMVNYWGGKSSIGVAQASCTIKKMTHQGTTYTITDVCKDNQSGDAIEGGPTVLKIASPTQFSMAGTSYRYCGLKPQW